MSHPNSTHPRLKSPDCPLESAALLYFDLETTGLHPERGATVTEAALLDGGGLRIHWQRDESDRQFDTVLPKLTEQLARGVVVGHNVGFDFNFLAYEAARRNATGPRVKFVDTLALARTLQPDRESYQLDSLVDSHEIEPNGPLHTARVDVLATRDLFWHLVEEHALETLEDAGLSQIDWSAV